MDSKAYEYLISDILETTSHVSDELPLQFTYPEIPVNDASFKAVSLFLEQLLSDSSLIPPPILSARDSFFFPLIFREIHSNFQRLFAADAHTPPISSSGRRNGMELLLFLCHAVTPKRITIFNENDALSFAMTCFLIEACMHAGWCNNAFENRAKRAAHIYFSLLKKALHSISDNAFSSILGYMQSAWLCAQKTEGIQDRRGEWEQADLVHRYTWEIESGEQALRFYCTQYKTIHPPVNIILPQNPVDIPHPLHAVSAEGRSGMRIFSGNEPIQPKTLLERTPIIRPGFKGERLDYLCETASGLQVRWRVAIQIYNATIYRIDLLRVENEAIILSEAALRLENSAPLNKMAENTYHGCSGRDTMVIVLIKNPLGLVYSGQEDTVSLFTAKEIALGKSRTIEMITAWALGKGLTAIDRTHLLGIFDTPEKK
jgi:hypothetical protein